MVGATLSPPSPTFLLVNLPLFSCFCIVSDESMTFIPLAQNQSLLMLNYYPYELFLKPNKATGAVLYPPPHNPLPSPPNQALLDPTLLNS